MIYRPMYVDDIMAYVDAPFVKVLTGDYVKIGLNQEKPYK